MEESILNTIKEMLGPDTTYNAFDEDIVNAINTALFVLWQVGAGPEEQPFTITGPEETWADFVDPGKYESVKTYICNRVKLAFDPPTSSFLIENLEKQNAEIEWRITVANDDYDDDGKSKRQHLIVNTGRY